jgi:transcriptional regulator
MSFQFCYLTPKQRSFWRLRFDGFTQAEISRKMGVTRQTVNKAFGVIDSKVAKALLEAAQLNKVEISRLDMERGFLLGRSHVFGLDTLVTFSDENGVQIWYRGEGRCSECEAVDSCREKLLIEAKVRGIEPLDCSEYIIPTKLADLLFKKIMEGGGRVSSSG